MRIVIERGDLLRALGHATSVVERRTTIPILSNVLLRADGDMLEFKATDLEREVIEQAPAKVDQPGAVTVPAHMLHDIVRKLPDGAQVELMRDAEKERLTLSSGHSRFALQTLPAEDFPDLAAGEMTHNFEIGAADLKRLIEKTRFAISTEETRYYLNGIYFHVATTGNKPTLRRWRPTATGWRRSSCRAPRGADGMPGVIIPRKTVHELHRLIEDAAPRCRSASRPAKVRFEAGTVTLTSKLIDGTFPDYGRVIPQANDKELKVSNAEFMSAVDRVSTIASERGRAVKLNITGDKLILSVNNPEGGSATEELDIDYTSTPLEIGFNARYLLDIAWQLESDNGRADARRSRLADHGSRRRRRERALRADADAGVMRLQAVEQHGK